MCYQMDKSLLELGRMPITFALGLDLANWKEMISENRTENKNPRIPLNSQNRDRRSGWTDECTHHVVWRLASQIWQFSGIHGPLFSGFSILIFLVYLNMEVMSWHSSSWGKRSFIISPKVSQQTFEAGRLIRLLIPKKTSLKMSTINPRAVISMRGLTLGHYDASLDLWLRKKNNKNNKVNVDPAHYVLAGT